MYGYAFMSPHPRLVAIKRSRIGHRDDQSAFEPFARQTTLIGQPPPRPFLERPERRQGRRAQREGLPKLRAALERPILIYVDDGTA